MQYIQLEKDKDVAVIWLDQPDEKVNKINTALLDEFEALLNGLEKDVSVRGIVMISKKPDSFIAGADIEQFLAMTNPALQASTLSRRGHAILNKIAGFPKPVVAAIHGAAIGGGIEVALACTMRIATDDPKTYFCLPEVKLGLLPGGGGTQRLPRLVGVQKALELMLTGKNVYAKKARKLGLVDHLIHPYGLLGAAKCAAMELAGKPMSRTKKLPFIQNFLENNSFTRNIIYKKSRDMVFRETMGNYPAPLKIIECVQTGVERGFDEGMEAEEEKFGELVAGSVSRELIRLFFNMNSKKKNPAKEKARNINAVGIIGAGLMGAGIAAVSSLQGMQVMLKDVDGEAVGRGEKAVYKELGKKVRQKALTPFERDRTMGRISGISDYKELTGAGLVIEAVFENLELKRAILRDVESVTRDNAIFASNTSSLPISEIAKDSTRPGQVIGMHYFSPVAKMPLLEIIITEKTLDWVTSSAVEVGIRHGKTVIVVKDGPGFYTTRILSPYLNEAIVLMEQGGDIREIDAAMKVFGFPVGPLTLLDEVGIDVGCHVSSGLLGELFARRGVESSRSLKRLYEAGYKGRKNRKGFYLYPEKPVKLPFMKKIKDVDTTIYSFFGGITRKKIDIKEIQDRLCLVMMNEAAHCLEEGIIQTPSDGDLGAILGLGFPPFLGGPFRDMDRTGINIIVSKLKKLEHVYGSRFSPCHLLLDMEKNNKKFYS